MTNVDPIRLGRNGAAVAKLVFGAILLLLNACTAFSQIRTGPEETLQRRMNVTACGYGFSGCDESQLTPVEIVQVNATRRRMNVTACEYGLSGCNESRLTSAEAAQVIVARRRINALMSGYELQQARSVKFAAPTRPNVAPAVAPAPPAVAENGSYYGELNKNGVPRTVHVDGYFRSNGKYVRGYYRSAPGTNPR